jgi:hypothetical protein
VDKFCATHRPANEQTFEFFVTQRSRCWKWRLYDSAGNVLMEGREKSRPAARYRAERALFLLLVCLCDGRNWLGRPRPPDLATRIRLFEVSPRPLPRPPLTF